MNKSLVQKVILRILEENKIDVNEIHSHEGKIIYEVLSECNRNMHEYVNFYKNLQREYREYIEKWVHEIKTPIASSKLIVENSESKEKNDVSRVFDKGFTGENGRKYGKSTGIGLYLCKKLCEKLGLGISLNSIEGKGTKVNIIFPLGNFTRLK